MIIFKYLRDKEDKLVFILLYDFKTNKIISIKINIKTDKAKESYLYKT
jgi:hypothetical protein